VISRNAGNDLKDIEDRKIQNGIERSKGKKYARKSKRGQVSTLDRPYSFHF
jgi:hypothetical protein